MSKFTTPFQMIIAAPAGAGKTNLMVNLVYDIGPSFDHIILFCKTYPNEPLHQLLPVSEKLRVIKHAKDLPDSPQNTLLVVDDMMSGDPEEIAHLTAFAARAPEASIMYITQCYRDVPRRIRESARYVVVRRICYEGDFKAIQVNAGVSMSELMECYKNTDNFITIDCKEHTIRADFDGAY